MNYGDIVIRVRGTLGDDSSLFLTDALLNAWINDGIIDVAKKVGNLEVIEQFDITANINAVDLSASNARIPVGVRRVFYRGRRLEIRTSEEVDDIYSERGANPATSDFQTSSSATPIYCFLFGNNLYLVPTPDTTESGALDVMFSYVPGNLPSVYNASSSIPLPLQYHETLVSYVKARAKERDEDWGAVDRFKLEYESSLAEDRSLGAHKERDSYPSVRLISGDD